MLSPEDGDCDYSVVMSPASEIIDMSQTSSAPAPPPAHPAADSTHAQDEGDNHNATERTPLLFDRKATTSPTDGACLTPDAKSLNRTRILLAISYASFSGILSGMCLIFAKSGVELLLLTLGGKNQFRRWETWVLLLGLVVFALLQLWYLHKALILADPTLVCPCTVHFFFLL